MGHVVVSSDRRVAHMQNTLARLPWQRPMLSPLAEIRQLALLVVEEQREALGRRVQGG